ncbi:hypothetical protein ACH52_1800 [Eubacterium limosum]|nr:hypothetical protein ACH52_1800 [Eubacterium limosum]
MADRRAEYRFKNGTVWDRLLFSIIEDCIIGGWIQSLGEKSYRKFPGGVILQWGWYDTNGATSTAVTLPIAFPNSVRAILTTASNSDLSFSDTSAVLVNNAKFNISTKSRSGWWIALGN